LLSALVPLHSSRTPLVHRDVNPSNIFILHNNLDLVLLDLSCATQSWPHSGNQIPVGRFGYTASEQLQGKAVPSSDLYSVGMVLYAMNQLKEPPKVSTRQHNDMKNLELRNITPTTNLQKVFYRLIAIDPTRRFSDASQAFRSLCPPLTIKDNNYGELVLPSEGTITMTALSWTYSKPDGTSQIHFW
jgi:serine/threonine protein kinase